MDALEAAGPHDAAPKLPLAVVMITLDEAENLSVLLPGVCAWAEQVFIVDSFSSDGTISVALQHGAQVVQRPFTGFGDQWNFAANGLPITVPWTMKLDPDERLTPELRSSIEEAIRADDADALSVVRRLWFMGRRLPVRQTVLRLWRTGTCRFEPVAVNEQPLVDGRHRIMAGELQHHDSPNLHHWYDKQNRYTTAEAYSQFIGASLAAEPRLFGGRLERRMWIKANFRFVPFRLPLVFLYNLFVTGAWRAGRVGLIWARLRTEVYRMRDVKLIEMEWQGKGAPPPSAVTGKPDPRLPVDDDEHSGTEG